MEGTQLERAIEKSYRQRHVVYARATNRRGWNCGNIHTDHDLTAAGISRSLRIGAAIIRR